MYRKMFFSNHNRKKKANFRHRTPFYAVVAFILSAFLTVSCHKRQPEEPLAVTEASTRYASLLQMQDLSHHLTLCRIQNPWQGRKLAIQYILVPAADSATVSDAFLDELVEEYGPMQVLVTPLQRQTVTACCHARLLEEFDAMETIGVLCDADYISSRTLRDALDNGAILDGGLATAPNVEVMLAAQTQAIWISPYEGSSQAVMQAVLPDLPVIYCADYMENTPLGRAEWVRFYGRLVDKAAVADSIFKLVETQYLRLSEASDSVAHPTLLADSPYGATWYVPGGRSTMSWLYQDAGFSYPWSDDTHSGSLALSPEAVFEKAQAADVWIIKYFSPDRDWTLSEFIGQNPLFAQFRAAQRGNVFGCNTAISDYFETTPFRPDVMLQEMQYIRENHSDSLRYFQRLK